MSVNMGIGNQHLASIVYSSRLRRYLIIFDPYTLVLDRPNRVRSVLSPWNDAYRSKYFTTHDKIHEPQTLTISVDTCKGHFSLIHTPPKGGGERKRGREGREKERRISPSLLARLRAPYLSPNHNSKADTNTHSLSPEGSEV